MLKMFLVALVAAMLVVAGLVVYGLAAVSESGVRCGTVNARIVCIATTTTHP